MNVRAQIIEDSLKSKNENPARLNQSNFVSKDSIRPFKFRRGVNYVIKMKNGETYTGFIVEDTRYTIGIEDRNLRRRYDLQRSEILDARVFSTRQIYDNILGENDHADAYMLTSSTFLFHEGSLKTTSHWFLLDHIDFAVNENFAVNVTSVLFYPWAIGLKCAFKLDDMNYVGGNVFGMANILSGNNNNTNGNNNTSPFLLGYGALGKFTHGTSNKNFTIGGGLLALNSEFVFRTPQTASFYNVFFSTISYCNRFSKRLALNLEGWFFPGSQTGFAGVGLKLVDDPRTCWTFGCYGIVNFQNNVASLNYKAIPIPYIGMAQKF
jgi:hypothetical protein